MAFTGLPRALAEFIATMELSRFELLMALLVFYIVIGCFLDGISSVVLTMAVVEPMIRAAGIDVIWFGIFIVVLAVIGLASCNESRPLEAPSELAGPALVMFYTDN